MISRLACRLSTVFLLFSVIGCGTSGEFEDEHHDDDHQHEVGGSNLTGYSLILQGQDLEGNDCFLGVVAPASGTESQLSVRTSFDHDGHGAGVLRASINGQRTEYNGVSGTGRILIQLASGARNLRGASSYVVSWQHDDHTDRAYCRNLRISS